VADNLERFDDELTVFSLLEGKKRGGARLGALSNVGFRVRGDGGQSRRPTTRRALARDPESGWERPFPARGIGDIVDIRNPVDLTRRWPTTRPTRNASAPSWRTPRRLAPSRASAFDGEYPKPAEGAGHDEDSAASPLAARYGRLKESSPKPWVAGRRLRARCTTPSPASWRGAGFRPSAAPIARSRPWRSGPEALVCRASASNPNFSPGA
jgi:hypothetical protein